MDLHGSTGNIAKRHFVRIGLTLKSLPDTVKSAYGVNRIQYHPGNSGIATSYQKPQEALILRVNENDKIKYS